MTDMEQNTVPSLRRVLKDVAMEKDAAVVAREDLSAQLRTLNKCLKEAEEEQYTAEEDAAALRSELNSIQQQMMNAAPSGNMHIGNLPNHSEALENELAKIKSELQQVLALDQQEQEQFVEERARMSAIISEKQASEEKLAAVTQKNSEDSSEKASQKSVSKMKDCLKQNDDLRTLLDKLRKEQANAPYSQGDATASPSEIVSLKRQLAKEQSRGEGLSAELRNHVTSMIRFQHEKHINRDR